MLIATRCMHCGQPYKLDDHLLEKQVRCQKCNAVFEVYPEVTGSVPVRIAEGPPPARHSAASARPQPVAARRSSPTGLILGLVAAGFCCLMLLGLVVGGVVIWLVVAASEEKTTRQERTAPLADDDNARIEKQRRELADAAKMIEEDERRKEKEKRKPDLQQADQFPKLKETTYPLTLNKGIGVALSQLGPNEPFDTKRINCRRKVYLVSLQAGRPYSILMSSREFDAYLRLENSQGTQLDEDDDSGGNFDALIKFTPPKTDTYRIIATTCGGGTQGVFTLTVREEGPIAKGPPGPGPGPIDPDPGPAPIKKTVQNGITITRFYMPADRLVEDLIWTPAGDAFFALSADGVLRRREGQDFGQEKKTELGSRTTCLAMSREGLLATMTELQEVWVIDPATLAIKKKIASPGVQRAVSAASLRYAIAAGDQGVTVLDLTKGAVANQFNKVPGQFARVTPDGKYYFAQGGVEQLCSYRIEGTKLIEYQQSERIAQNGQRICVSPDSKWVCLPSSGGNYGAGNFSTFIYSVDDVKKAAFTIATGAYPKLVGFDPVSKTLFAQNADMGLLVYSMTASKLKELNFGNDRDEPLQFVTHPQGRKLLVQTSKAVLLVELGTLEGKERGAVGPDPKLPGPTSPRQSLAKNKSQKDGLAITELNLASDKLVNDLLWTPRGDAFFALTKEGVLSRVALAQQDFVEEKRVDLGQQCSFLALSAEGLVATMTELEEVWVIDPAKLEVRKRIAAPKVQRAVSSPALKTAIAVGQEGVSVIDLVQGKIAPQFGQLPTRHARASPDGKYYFAEGGIEQLCSYRIQGTDLIEHQKTERIAQNGQSICISPDSKWVCLPSGGGNYGAGGGNYNTFVYSVDDLRTAAFTVKSGAYPRLAAFDPVDKVMFTQNHDKQLMVFTMDGKKLKEFNLPTGGDPKQFVPHPKGKKLLVVLERAVLFVDLENAGLNIRDARDWREVPLVGSGYVPAADKSSAMP
jgi:DNA-binding beta-propeller fold protein YncE